MIIGPKNDGSVSPPTQIIAAEWNELIFNNSPISNVLHNERHKPSFEQYEVIDNLIDSIDLDSREAFKRLYDPNLEPEKPLTEIDDDMKDLL